MDLFKKSLTAVFAVLFLFMFLFVSDKIFAYNQRSFIINTGGGMITEGYEEINDNSFFSGDVITFLGSLEFSGMGLATGHMTGAIVGQSTTKDIIPLQTLPIGVPINGFNNFSVPGTPGNYLARFITTTLGNTDTYDFPFTVLGTIPTLNNTNSSSITSTSAILGANVTLAGNPAIVLTRGVCYGLTSSSMTTCLSATGTLGAYTISVSSLLPGTKYYYRGYATNATGTGYSPTLSFVTVPSITLNVSANPTTVISGGVSTISWNSEGADFCTLSGGGISGSGVNNTGVLTNPITSSTTYSVTCTKNPQTVASSCTGTYTGVNQSCVGSLAGNTCGFDESEGCDQFGVSNCYLPSDPWCHHACHLATTSLPGLLCSQYNSSQTNCMNYSTCVWNPSYSVPVGTITKTVTVSPSIIILDYNPTNKKDLVDAGNNDTNGQSQLVATISGLSSGQSCGLRNITNDPNTNIGNSFTADGSYNRNVSDVPSGENKYQVICTDGSTSNIVTVNGQSGTLEATNGTSCQIPAGGSSCSIPLTWTTISPANSFTTKLYKDGVATSLSGNNSSGTVSVNYGTNPVYSTKNKIDGEGANNNETVDNELANLPLSAECVSTAHWDTSTLQCVSNSTPLSDLTALGINPTGAFLNSPRSFTSTVINNGDVSTGAKPFYTLFQVGIDQSAGGGGGGGVGLNNNKRSNSFWNFIFSKTQKVSAAPEYTIIGNYPTASAITDLGVGEISNVTSPNINFSSVGTYYMRACADKNSQSDIFGVITESDENNNCGDWVPVSVTPVPPVPAPDLTAYVPSTTAGIGGTQPLTYTTTVGKTLTFYSTISNEGSLTTGKSFQNSFQIQSDITQYIATPNPMPALANGAMATASKAIKFSNVGTYKIRACADIPPINPGVVSESDENNNCSEYATINVAEPNYPDLVASGITPTEVAVGVSTVFNATITNDPRSATAPAVSSNGKGFYNLLQWYDLDDPFETIHNVTGTDMISTPLLVGESAILSRRVTFSESGSYMVRVCADKSTIGDIGGTVDEGSNEGNNCGDWTIVRVGIGADLEPSAITPTTAIVGVDTSFYADIINKGNASALSSNGKGFFNLLQWYLADDPSMVIHNITSEELIATPFASGATETITRHMNFSNTGEYMARVCADLDTAETKNNLVVESNEGNNCGAWVLITVIKPSEPSGEITATDCEIEDGYSSCETKINWSITSPILGADTAVTTNLPNPYNTELVATGNSGTTTYKLEYTESPRTFYLYHNNIEPPKTAEARATCKNNNWNGTVCLSAGEDSITASDCTIQAGEGTCLSNIVWYTASPVGISQVTTPGLYEPSNTEIVANGNQGHTTYPVSINDRWFFLYNNGIELKKESGKGFCASGTKWDSGRSACVEIIDFENGVCLDNHNQCSGGDSIDLADTDDYYLWMCKGKNGGSDDNCSEAKNPGCLNGALNPPACDCWNPSGCGIGVGGGDVTLTAVPSWIFKGRSSTLTWESWPGATCTINPGNVSLGDTDNLQVSPLTTTTYTAECVDSENNTDSAETTVRVIKPIIFEN